MIRSFRDRDTEAIFLQRRVRRFRGIERVATRMGEIVHGRRGITADTALRLARYFNTTAKLWFEFADVV